MDTNNQENYSKKDKEMIYETYIIDSICNFPKVIFLRAESKF